MARFFFTRHYDFLLRAFKDDQPDLQQHFKRAFLQSVKSHNLFLELGHLKDARLSLINAYELNRLAKLYYSFDVTTELATEEILLNNLRASEQAMGVNMPYQPIVDNAFARYSEIQNTDSDVSFAQMNDDQIEQYATIILGTYGLPGDRLINIIGEMKTLKYFNLHCDREKFLISCNNAHTRSFQPKYASPSSFILVNKATGIESLPSTDIEKLANSFGALKK